MNCIVIYDRNFTLKDIGPVEVDEEGFIEGINPVSIYRSLTYIRMNEFPYEQRILLTVSTRSLRAEQSQRRSLLRTGLL